MLEKNSLSSIIIFLILFSIVPLIVIGCQSFEKNPASPSPDEENQDPPPNKKTPLPEESLQLTQEELNKYRPNELGQVMILMYHSIGTEESEWTRTPKNFRKDLNELYSRGYRLISLLDYVQGNINLPAGTSPVILTFDDSSRGQFNYLKTDSGVTLDPDSAVGILESFCKEHPDFGRAASFYIYYPVPFRQKEYIQQKLEFLQNNGYEIGNHNYTHGNLSKLSRDEGLKELALNARATADYLPGYEVLSLALPYGGRPEDSSLLEKGIYEGFSYRLEAVLNVGSNPAASPFHISFEPLNLPRIRASEIKVDNVGMYNYIAYFDNHPNLRYVSDGKTGLLTAPELYRDKVNKEMIGKRTLQFYTSTDMK